MHCLRWWLPIFLLPLPAVSPFMMILFVTTYAIRTKPCAYCAVIILGLMFSTCALFSSTYSSTTSFHLSQESSSSISELQNQTLLHPTKHYQQQKDSISPSSCWIDLSCGFLTQNSEIGVDRRDSETSNLGWWSAPTKRKSPTHLRSWWTSKEPSRLIKQKSYDQRLPSSSSLPSTLWLTNLYKNGIYIGFPGSDSGFRIRLFVD